MLYVGIRKFGASFYSSVLSIALALALPACLSKEGPSSIVGSGRAPGATSTENPVAGPSNAIPDTTTGSAPIAVAPVPPANDPVVVAAQAVAAANTLNSNPDYALSEQDIAELQAAEALSAGEAATLAPLLNQ